MTAPHEHSRTRDDAPVGARPGAPPGDGGVPVDGAGTRVLDGRYLLEEHLADGGMAAVWRAHDEVLARTVAVKVLHRDLAVDDVFRERFRREAVAAAKLVHPNVVALYDTGRDGDAVYLVMEYIDGVTLEDLVDAEGPLEVGQACHIGQRVAQALAYAHRRDLVHRDVKPANVLVCPDGRVVVTDFGIAKLRDDSSLTATGRVMGTAAYVAPEQLRGQPVDGRADQYSLGLVLYEALTGQRAFTADNAVSTAAERLRRDPHRVRALRADIPRSLDETIARMLARDPDARFADMEQVASALAAHADHSTGPMAAVVAAARPDDPEDAAAQAPGPEPGSPGGFIRTEGRWLWPAVGLLVLAGVLVGVGLLTGVLTNESGTSLFAQEVTPTEPAGEVVATPTDPPTTAPPVRALPILESSTFDPPPDGDGTERDRFLPNVHDGAPDTEWATELYNTAAFGNLKEGVGFYVDLGEPAAVAAVTLDVTTPGIAYEIRVAQQLDEQDVSAWQPVVGVTDAPEGESTHQLDGTPVARYVMVYVTGDLQPDGDQFRAGFAEMSVAGVAA